MANIDLLITADDSELIKRLNDIENRMGKLSKLADQSGKAQQKAFAESAAAADKMGKSLASSNDAFGQIGGLVAGLGLVAGITAIGKEIFDVTAKMESLQTSFTNAFSKEGANAALVAAGYMQEIKDIAKTTPFEFDALAESILKLTNQGFEPTRAEIIKLGDLASTTGKDFSQLAEAVIDAQVGEFERLKEFGIRAAKANGEVTLSFKGQTTVVQDNEVAIRNAIVAFGDLQGVQGAMAAQALTLKGQLSNVADSLSQLGAEIGSRLAPEIAVGIQGFSDFVNSLNVDAIFEFFKPISEKLLPALKNMYDALLDAGKALTGTSTDGEFFQKVMNGLSFAFELVVDAVTLIIDEISFFTTAIKEAYQEGGIFTAVIDGIVASVSIFANALKFVLEGLQKLYLGEEKYNERANAAIEADKKRVELAIERKKKDEDSAKALDEHRKSMDKNTKSTVVNKDAQKDAAKALKDYEDLLKSTTKAIEDYEKKAKKAKISSFKGEEKVEAQRDFDQEELTKSALAEDKKIELVQKKYKEGSKKYEELQKQRNLLAFYVEQERAQIEVNAANAILDIRQENLKKQEDANQKEIEAGQKLLNEKQKQHLEDVKEVSNWYDQNKDLQVAEIDIQIGALEARKDLNAKELAQLQQLNEDKILVQIDYLVAKRKFLLDEFSAESPEVKQVDLQIAGFKNALSKLQNNRSVLDPIEKFKAKIQEELGLNDADFAYTISAVQTAISEIGNAFKAANEEKIKQNEKVVDSLKNRISETESALKTEEELQRKGFANAADAKRAELASLKIEEKKALDESKKLRKQALREELASNLISQGSNLALTVAKTFSANASLPFGVGLAISLFQIAAMFASFAKFKSQIKALDQSAYQGGSLTDYLQPGERSEGFVSRGGSSDRPGHGGRGYKVLGTNLRIGGDEFLMNDRASQKHHLFLSDMNKGMYDGVDLATFFKQRPLPSISVMAQKADKHMNNLIRFDRQRETDNFNKMHRENADRIVLAIKNQEKYVALPDGYMKVQDGNKEIVRFVK